MKSTYELLSIFLDRQPLPLLPLRIINLSEVPECSEIGEEYNLFDLPVCKRKISGLKLLSMTSASETTSLVSRLVDCKEIFIVLDYNSTSSVACKLFLKRVLQAATFLISEHLEIDIVLVGSDYCWMELLQLIYGKALSNEG